MNINFIMDHDNQYRVSQHNNYITNLVSCTDKSRGRSYDCAVVLDTGKHCVERGTVAAASQRANYNSCCERDIVRKQSDGASEKE